ncbi:SHOCT domain-containing protein [Pseudarthrobacter sulfonivorans]|uniref:SHOCT domain-containing protein n=1 Tax=Pseudarthrobacter sulfonivorans TaxID=121292 RepID=UPI001CC32432
MFGKITGKKSLAAELTLLAELHRSGALSDEEFSAAKDSILGSRSPRSARSLRRMRGAGSDVRRLARVGCGPFG